jgi:CHASE2 domain-containing sensor protein
MEKPEAPDRPRGSCVSIILAASLAVAVCTGLVAITLLVFGGVIAVAAAIFAFAALHYFAWGWWLPQMIHAEEQADRQAEDLRDERLRR